MKEKSQSHKFPEHLSEYYKKKQQNEDTLQIVAEDTNESIFQRSIFSICDIIGNFDNGFILVHFNGYLYMIDQHAASQKSLFLQYLINPTRRYTQEMKEPLVARVANYYMETLEVKEDVIKSLGWKYEIMEKKASETTLRIMEVPLLYGKQLKEQDFLFLIDKLYVDRECDSNSYSSNQRNYMASFACHNAIKIGDKLLLHQIRGLIDSLYKMDAPFNCPHGRPTLVSLGQVQHRIQGLATTKTYHL